MSSSIPTALTAQPQPPNCQPGWVEFYRFVTTNLGDVPVLDDGKFISLKIQGYWIVWCFMGFLNEHKLPLLLGYFDLIVSNYLPPMPLPPTRTDYMRVQRFWNLWKLLGGQTT